MLKHDSMTQYVSDRAPRFAPRAPRHATWSAAALASEGRRRANPTSVVVDLATRRIDRANHAALAGILA